MWKMKMTATTGFSTEDFAGGVQVICYPSFRLSSALTTSVPCLKTCKFWSWLSFGVDLAPFSFYSLSANFSSACPLVSPLTLWVLFGEIQQPADKKHQIPLLDKDKDTLFCDWASLLIYTDDLYTSWTSTVSKLFRAKEASLHPHI